MSRDKEGNVTPAPPRRILDNPYRDRMGNRLGTSFHALVTTLVLLVAVPLSAISSPASGKKPEARYPSELLGVWQGDDVVCSLPGNLDSDTRIDIKPSKLVDYEQWNEPKVVLQISKKPQAWKIRSNVHIDGGVFDRYEVYLLSGQDKGTLTVIDQNRSMKYVRCK